MKLRAFLASLPAALFSAKSIALPKPTLVSPTQAYPPHDQEYYVGLWVQGFDSDKKKWGEPYLIIREFDDNIDNPWRGVELSNVWRNKFFGRALVSGKYELLCIDRWDSHLRFFKNAPNTDWSTVYPV